MDYAQERVATLHDLTGAVPDAPVGDACVVVPMTEAEHASLAVERVLSALETVGPGRVVVPLRAPADRVAAFEEWLSGFDLPLSVLWCSADPVLDLLADAGLAGDHGKGRDVWLALGVAAEGSRYVVCHDADPTTYDETYVPRLLAPLARGFAFSKGYYARVEEDRLYGRLFRLFYAPLVRAIRDRSAAPLLAYLDAFRYALAGEFAATADLARSVRVERGFGLEVGLLVEAFRVAGPGDTAQVDLGRYAHEHRAVGGPTGLAEMSRAVGAALFRGLEDHGIDPGYADLSAAYREAADALIRGYAADAAYNGLAYDADAEREQVRRYADAIGPPGGDDRLPPWTEADLDPGAVLAASREAIAEAKG